MKRVFIALVLVAVLRSVKGQAFDKPEGKKLFIYLIIMVTNPGLTAERRVAWRINVNIHLYLYRVIKKRYAKFIAEKGSWYSSLGITFTTGPTLEKCQ